MFERIKTSAEVYRYNLGVALTMERCVIEILESSIEEAQEDRVAALFTDHRQDSSGHISVLEEVFASLGWEPDSSPCPAIEGLQAQATANTKKTAKAIVDEVLLQAALEVEHYEIAVYEGLILNARAMGREPVVRLLQRNLESEKGALEAVSILAGQLAIAAYGGSDSGGLLNKVKNVLG